jgi:hypothetical protein
LQDITALVLFLVGRRTGALICLPTAARSGAEPLTIKIGYVGRASEKKVPISLLGDQSDNR